MENNDNDGEIIKSDKNLDRYTFKYRILKTMLLILAWICFGLNNEIIGPTFEDLRILLDLNYQLISTLLVIRFVGYLIGIFVSGLIFERFKNYSELLMAIFCLSFGLPNILIPMISNYTVQLFLNGIMGLATG
jgi:MFS family permease